MAADKNDEVIIIHPQATGETMPIDPPAVHNPPAKVARSETQTGSPAAAIPAYAAPVAGTERALGLDVFRGLLMIGMVFSFAILGKAGLPWWMYHMQFPPPDEQYVRAAGLTWRDVIFPGFLFTLAAAIPLATAKHIARNTPYPAIILSAIKRAAVLFVFALIIGHTNPYWTKDYTRFGNVMAIIGFLACWPLLLDRRADWNEKAFRSFKTVGALAIVLLLLALPRLYDSSFSLMRKDNIIHALAFSALAVVPIWLFTRNNIPARLTIVAAIVALKISVSAPGWAQDLWGEKSFLIEPWFIELLIITLPGTVAGELILKWMRRPQTGATSDHWTTARVRALAVVCAAITPILLIGLYTRYVAGTTVAVLATCAVGAALAYRPVSERDRVLAQLFSWGAVFLILGMLLEPYEGGIKKDPQTLSFLVLMTGFSFVSLVAILVLSDLSVRGGRFFRPVAQIGRNALLMYVLFTLFISHAAYLTGVGNFFTEGPIPALARAVFFTALTSMLVWYATTKRIFWKA